MGLDRDELAARFAVADYGAAMPTGGRGVVATNAVAMADALLSALSPPAAVAPVAYVPKPGDVVSLSIDTGGPRTRVAISGEEYVMLLGTASGGTFPFRNFGLSKFTYLRPATPAEREAAGLPVEPAPDGTPSNHPATNDHGQPVRVGVSTGSAGSATPAPEAKRPTHVRVTGPKDTRNATIGKVYEVLHFDADRDRLIIRGDDGLKWGLSNKPGESSAFPTWEPCDAPAPTPPAPSREEALAMALREVRRMVEGGVYRATITTYIDATLSRPAATKGGA